MCDDVEWFSPDSSIAIWFCFVFKDFELKQSPLLEHPLLDPFSVIEQVSVTGKPLIGQVETPSFGEVYNYRCKTTLTIVHFIREPGKESPFDRLFFQPSLNFSHWYNFKDKSFWELLSEQLDSLLASCTQQSASRMMMAMALTITQLTQQRAKQVVGHSGSRLCL